MKQQIYLLKLRPDGTQNARVFFQKLVVKILQVGNRALHALHVVVALLQTKSVLLQFTNSKFTPVLSGCGVTQTGLPSRVSRTKFSHMARNSIWDASQMLLLDNADCNHKR